MFAQRPCGDETTHLQAEHHEGEAREEVQTAAVEGAGVRPILREAEAAAAAHPEAAQVLGVQPHLEVAAVAAQH